MEENRRDISINKIIIIVFVLAITITIGSIGYLIFRSWVSSAEKITETVSQDISDNLYNKIYSFIDIPNRINEENRKDIENEIFDIGDERMREKYLVSVLTSQRDEIYSLSYATVDGRYHGVRRNDSGRIEILKSNIDTGGRLYHYSTNEDLTANTLVSKSGKYDPRTKDWYKVVAEKGKPSFSPIYKDFLTDDLTISASHPIYDEDGNLQGVLAIDILLSDIGVYLEQAVRDYKGYAIIFEKETENLVANSIGAQNFSILKDDVLKRYTVCDIEDSAVQKTCKLYDKEGNPNFIYKGGGEKFYVNIKEINMEGLDWVVVSAVPESIYMTTVSRSVRLTIGIAFVLLIASLLAYSLATKRLLSPIGDLLEVSEALASGDLSKRVKVRRNDEIGIISRGLNKVADKMESLIQNLEENVEERTESLYHANLELEENKEQLQLILDSTMEGIYGLDLDGKCTFCNLSGVQMLGFESHKDLLGKNIHKLIHHSDKDGNPIPVSECKILQATKEGRGYGADDEIFWRADGSYFQVEYHSYPQIKDGKVIGGVVSFLDITDRKKKEEEIRYLNYHDTLTGLYNRRYFQKKRKEIDVFENLPLSVIFADINGLKLTNDIFGHAVGDKLIKKSSQIIANSCRESDIIARIGGDEFIILLPNTNKEAAEKIIARIKKGFETARVEAIKCSVSLGYDTKLDPHQPLENIITNAEDEMYKDKTMSRRSINKDIIKTLLRTLHFRHPEKKRHSTDVSKLAEKMGKALNLAKPEINKLKKAAYLHGIGKIAIDENILSKEDLTDEELEEKQRHTEFGYRILNLCEDTMDLAEYVYTYQERWDGKGYPRGLKGDQIPLIARIISIVEAYDRLVHDEKLAKQERKGAALEQIEKEAGKRFDPELSKIFIEMMKKTL